MIAITTNDMLPQSKNLFVPIQKQANVDSVPQKTNRFISQTLHEISTFPPNQSQMTECDQSTNSVAIYNHRSSGSDEDVDNDNNNTLVNDTAVGDSGQSPPLFGHHRHTYKCGSHVVDIPFHSTTLTTRLLAELHLDMSQTTPILSPLRNERKLQRQRNSQRQYFPQYQLRTRLNQGQRPYKDYCQEQLVQKQKHNGLQYMHTSLQKRTSQLQNLILMKQQRQKQPLRQQQQQNQRPPRRQNQLQDPLQELTVTGLSTIFKIGNASFPSNFTSSITHSESSGLLSTFLENKKASFSRSSITISQLFVLMILISQLTIFEFVDGRSTGTSANSRNSNGGGLKGSISEYIINDDDYAEEATTSDMGGVGSHHSSTVAPAGNYHSYYNYHHHSPSMLSANSRYQVDYPPELRPNKPRGPLHPYRIFLQKGVSSLLKQI